MADVPEWMVEAERLEDERRERMRLRLAGKEESAERAAFVAAQQERVDWDALLPPALRDMRAKACGGSRERVSECWPRVEAACSEKGSTRCPKRILAWERAKSQFEAGYVTAERSYQAQGIPDEIARLIADAKVDQRPAVTSADAWWSSKPRTPLLVLAGDSQAGKTVAAANLIARFGGRFLRLEEWPERMNADDLVRDLRLSSLVCFDDCGTEADRFGEARQRWANLVCGRVDGGLFTILTANGLQLFRRLYGDRLAERLNGKSTTITVTREAA